MRATAEKKPLGAPALAPAPADPRAGSEGLARHLAHSATVATLASVTDSLRSAPANAGGVPHANSSAVSSYVLLADPAASAVSLRRVQEMAAKADMERVQRSPRASSPRMPQYIAEEIADAVAKAAAEDAYRNNVAARLELSRKASEKVVKAAVAAAAPGGTAPEEDPATAARRRRASFVKESLGLLQGSIALLPAREFSLLPSHGDLLSQRIADLAAGPSLEPGRRLSYMPVFEAPSLPHDTALMEELEHDANRRRRSITIDAVPLDRPSGGAIESLSLGLTAPASQKHNVAVGKPLSKPHPPLRYSSSTASLSAMLPRRFSRGLLPRGASMASIGSGGGIADSEGAVSLRHLLHPHTTSTRVASLGLVSSDTATALEERQTRLRRSESWAVIEGANVKGFYRPPPVQIIDPASQSQVPQPAAAIVARSNSGSGAGVSPRAEASAACPQPRAVDSYDCPAAGSPRPLHAVLTRHDGGAEAPPGTPATVPVVSSSSLDVAHGLKGGGGSRLSSAASALPESIKAAPGAGSGAAVAPTRAPVAASPRTSRRFVYQPEEGSRAQVAQLFEEYDRPPVASLNRSVQQQQQHSRRDSAISEADGAKRRLGSPSLDGPAPAVGLRSTTLAPQALPASVTQLHLQHLELPGYLLASHVRDEAAGAVGGELQTPFHTLAMTSLVVHAPMDPAIGQLLRKRRLRRYGVADYAPREKRGGEAVAGSTIGETLGGTLGARSPRRGSGDGLDVSGGARPTGMRPADSRSVSPRLGPLAARQQAAALLAASATVAGTASPLRAAGGSLVKAASETRPAAAVVKPNDINDLTGQRHPARSRRSIEDLTRALDAAIESTTASARLTVSPTGRRKAQQQALSDATHHASSAQPSNIGVSGPSPAAIALRKLEEGRLSARIEAAMDRDLSGSLAAVRQHKQAGLVAR